MSDAILIEFKKEVKKLLCDGPPAHKRVDFSKILKVKEQLSVSGHSDDLVDVTPEMVYEELTKPTE